MIKERELVTVFVNAPSSINGFQPDYLYGCDAYLEERLEFSAFPKKNCIESENDLTTTVKISLQDY